MHKEATPPRAGLTGHWRFPLPISAVYLAAPVLVLMVAALLNAIKPYDYFWALAQGREIARTASNTTQNLFLYTLPTDAAYFNQPWLSQLVLYGFATHLGHGANVVLLACALALAMAVVLDAGLRLGIGPRGLAVAALLASPLLAMGAGVRTQLFAFPCLALAARLLFVPGWNRRRLLWLLLVTAVHTNLHGSFVLVPVLAAAAMLGKRELPMRLRWLTVGAVLLAGCLHPHGPRVLAYALSQPFALGVAGTSSIEEWKRLSPSTPLGAGFLLGVLLWLAVAWRGRTHLQSGPALAFVALAIAATVTVRFVPFAALLAPLSLPALGPMPTAPPTRTQGRVHLAFLVVFALVVLGCLPPGPLARMLARNRSVEDSCFASEVPLALAERLTSLRPGRTFHTQAVGGLIEWTSCRQGPAPVAFVDQRFELIPGSIWGAYAQVCGASAGFEEILNRYGVRAVLAEPKESRPLLDALAANPAWRSVGREGEYRLYWRP